MSTKYSVQLQESQQPSCHNPYNVFYDNYLNTNATTECTGLGYRDPHTREGMGCLPDRFLIFFLCHFWIRRI